MVIGLPRKHVISSSPHAKGNQWLPGCLRGDSNITDKDRKMGMYIIRPALQYCFSPSDSPSSYVVNGNNRLPACSLSFTLHSGAVRIGMISVAAKETLLS